ncbi:MAG: BamA/TamA family outer membrane protein [Bacteroidetes bacterium]|nr:BamA/TamA family outer membrane protein [Bacteroidota bacterium]
MKILYTFLFLFTFTLQSARLSAQQKSDTTKLPFAIADEKKLSDEDLKDKKEGTYLTGEPEFSSDPVNGFGYGAEGSIFFNGKRSDPFFAYTAYRARLDFVLFNTTKNQREFGFTLDIPYILNTKWRFRASGAIEQNPNLLYFGTTAKESLRGLSYVNGPGDTAKNVSYSDYEKNFLTGANQFYNNYNKQEEIINLSLERNFLEGRLRALVGFEMAHLNMTPLQNNALIQQDFNAGKIYGLGHSWVNIYQLGLVYDTRDLEPDPSKGIVAEVTNELSLKALGSSFDFDKVYAHLNFYQKIFPSVFNRLIFAGRIAMGYTALDAPFFEYQDQWSPEGDIEGLGGPRTLRGYKQSRFLGRAMHFSNFELRWRFAQSHWFKQHFEFSAVPFYDIGGVWDNLSAINTNNLRYSRGGGLRIVWNESTVLRFDYAVSKEDQQFFFNLAHTF